jgi:ABC-2 type transport system ATP-binding protein
VVDEVLAVGDENFQRKCLARIKDFQNEGRTILFVTHSADLVRQICDRAVVLSAGQMIGLGPSADAIHLYHDHLLVSGSAIDAGVAPADGAAPPEPVHRPILITGVELEHPGMGSRSYLLPDEPLTVHVDFEATEPTADVVFAVEIYDDQAQLVFASNTGILEQFYDIPVGRGRADLIFDRVPLLEGAYSVSVGLWNRHGVVYDLREQVRFEVMNPGRSRGRVALELRADVRAASLS